MTSNHISQRIILVFCTLHLAALSYLVIPLLSARADSGKPASPTPAPTGVPGGLGYNPLIEDMVQLVSQEQISTTILNLQDADEIPGWDTSRSRSSYSPGVKLERDYIRHRMEELGLDVRYQNFSLYGTSQDNIEGTLAGWEPGSEIIYITCAHYDSTSNDPGGLAPGADDNASGTAAVLEAARILSQYRFKHTLRFVTFAAEEQGLIGSYFYTGEAQTLQTNIGGVVNLDMIAWDSDNNNVMEVHAGTNGNSQALGTTFITVMDTYHILLTPHYFTTGANTRSDHSRFWTKNYPAIMAIEDTKDFNPYYHQAADTLDKLNLPYATKFTQATVATLAELAEVLSPGVRIGHSGPTIAAPGRPITLTIQYSNPGSTSTTGVVITNTLSEGLAYIEDNSGVPVTQPGNNRLVWQLGSVAPFSRTTFVVTATVNSSLSIATTLSSTVEISGVVSVDDPADNRATWMGSVGSLKILPILLKESH